MIRIYDAGETLISDDAKHYNIEDVDWLTRFHNNEPFVLLDGTLWEAEEPFGIGKKYW